jgi:glucosyl-dolichyl phosphate glucuronosyltransferase
MITVGVPTYNRAESLGKTLEAINALKPPDCGWEVIVVDNGSEDNTRDVCDRQLPTNGRYIYESRPGVSNARNRVVSEALGSLIVFTDDDTEPEAEWLREYEAAARQYPSESYFMGTTYWVWSAAKPWWYSDADDHTITFCYRHENPGEEGPIPESIAPAGPNMALRRSVFEEIGVFDPALGIVGRKKIGGEEPDLFRRASRVGMHGRIVPGARVGHRVYPELTSLRSLFGNMLAAGLSDSLRIDMYECGPRFCEMPRWWMKSLCVSPIHHALHIIAHSFCLRPVAIMHHMLRMAYWVGRMRYLCGRRRVNELRARVGRRI